MKISEEARGFMDSVLGEPVKKQETRSNGGDPKVASYLDSGAEQGAEVAG